MVKIFNKITINKLLVYYRHSGQIWHKHCQFSFDINMIKAELQRVIMNSSDKKIEDYLTTINTSTKMSVSKVCLR